MDFSVFFDFKLANWASVLYFQPFRSTIWMKLVHTAQSYHLVTILEVFQTNNAALSFSTLCGWLSLVDRGWQRV